MTWNRGKIGDHCEITSSKRIFLSDYVGSGIPFWRSKEVIEQECGIVSSESLYISFEKYNEIKNRFGVPKLGDMLLTSVGTIGVPHIVKNNEPFYFKDGNLTWFRNFSDTLSSYYLYYWIKSNIGHQTLNNLTIGSSQKALTIDALKKVEIPLPDIETQHRIASILSAYDDLIENNRRQIKLLEEAAQRLYREWFVELRFPGHEDVKIVDGVPEGWKITNVNEVMTFHRGYDLTKDSFIHGAYPVVGTTSVLGYHNEYKVHGPGIVTGRSGSLGQYQFMWENFWPHNTSLYVSDAKGHEMVYLYALLQTLDFSRLSSGGAIPSLNRNLLSSIEVLEPPMGLQQAYVEMAGDMYAKVRACQKIIDGCSQVRDMLLPKLMSGEIEVLPNEGNL